MSPQNDPPLVFPFFRASVNLPGCNPRAGIEALVEQADGPLCSNLQRLLAAALVAERTGGSLCCVEGWKSNRLDEVRFTGSALMAHLLAILQRAHLAPPSLELEVHDRSRCTWEELEAIRELADGRNAIGITASPSPSAARARRYAHLLMPGALEVYTPDDALGRFDIVLSPSQRLLLEHVNNGPGFWRELPNWILHVMSRCERMMPGRREPLEKRLAHRLRIHN